MIIAVPGEKQYETVQLLDLHDLFGLLGPTHPEYHGATILLATNEGKQLPLYLRSEMAGRLVALGVQARTQKAAIIIPDVVQCQLFRSKVLYPEGIDLHARDDQEQYDADVQQAKGILGILEKEKLLLLELLLGKEKWSLEQVEHVLRADKVFCLKQKVQGSIPADRHYIIVKFDSAAAIDREVKNFKEVEELLYGPLSSQRYLEWFETKVYKILDSHGCDTDLFKVIASTVKTSGAVANWKRQTLTDRWDEFNELQRESVIANAFSTLEDLYRLGLAKQKDSQPSEVSIDTLYERFYKRHIMPVECVVKCKLTDIGARDPQVVLQNDSQTAPHDVPLQYDIGQTFDQDCVIEEIKIRKDDYGKATLSLICSMGQRRIEFMIGRLGGFEHRRAIYSKNLVIGGRHRFRGKVDATCESRFRENFEQVEFSLLDVTEAVVNEDDFDQRFLQFVDNQKLLNPFHIYSELSRSVGTEFGTRKFKSIATWCHGDLNAGNIIATDDGESRIIDFARLAKDGPLEFDFAELELDLRIRNLVKQCKVGQSVVPTVKDLFTFERGLLRVFTDQNEDVSFQIPEALRPGFRAIRQIRRGAISLYQEFSNNALTPSEVLLPYMTAIFFESLAVWTMDIPKNASLPKTWALIAGTVACEQIVGANNTMVRTSA